MYKNRNLRNLNKVYSNLPLQNKSIALFGVLAFFELRNNTRQERRHLSEDRVIFKGKIISSLFFLDIRNREGKKHVKNLTQSTNIISKSLEY